MLCHKVIILQYNTFYRVTNKDEKNLNFDFKRSLLKTQETVLIN